MMKNFPLLLKLEDLRVQFAQTAARLTEKEFTVHILFRKPQMPTWKIPKLKCGWILP